MDLLLSKNGKSLKINKKTKPSEVIEALGLPTNSWDDDVEKCIVYETESAEIEISFDISHFVFKPEGKLKYVSIEIKEKGH
jgi:hypothetical protein